MERGFHLGSMFYVPELALCYGGLVQWTSLSLTYFHCMGSRSTVFVSLFANTTGSFLVYSFLPYWSLLLAWWLCLRLLMLALGWKCLLTPTLVGTLPDAHLSQRKMSMERIVMKYSVLMIKFCSLMVNVLIVRHFHKQMVKRGNVELLHVDPGKLLQALVYASHVKIIQERLLMDLCANLTNALIEKNYKSVC